jgi:hypothetical protein
MKSAFKVFVTLAVILFTSSATAGSSIQPPADGEVLPEFDLAVPQNQEHQEYLGISGKTSFKIPEIKTEVVIIEIFNMH